MIDTDNLFLLIQPLLHQRCRCAAGAPQPLVTKITKNLSVTAKRASAVNLTHRKQGPLRGVGKRGSLKGGRGQSEKCNESGTWREKREKLLSRFKGSKGGKGERRPNTKSETPFFHLTGRNENLCRYQGGCLLFWCFYSNSFYVPILPTCRFIIMQHVEKKHTHTQMPETM